MTLFDLAKIKEELDRTNREIEQEDFWNDPDYAQKVMKEKKNMEDTVEGYEDLQNTLDDIEELIEMTGDDDQSVAEEIQAMFDDVSRRADDMRVKTPLERQIRQVRSHRIHPRRDRRSGRHGLGFHAPSHVHQMVRQKRI